MFVLYGESLHVMKYTATYENDFTAMTILAVVPALRLRQHIVPVLCPKWSEGGARKVLGWPKRWKLARSPVGLQLQKAEVGPTSGPTWWLSH
jgi:hypothetical protein